MYAICDLRGKVYALQISNQDNPLTLARAASISLREQEILLSLDAGLSNQESAARYSISDSTVKTHLENIFRKLEVSSRTQVIVKAKALDLL